ncbi:hypothetical protein HDU76_007767 [Blyttiomyces sp. JEL0837]|nr:hypothetical protein HDU76_007767 [Blyttiomyces sp. JEL0837]
MTSSHRQQEQGQQPANNTDKKFHPSYYVSWSRDIVYNTLFPTSADGALVPSTGRKNSFDFDVLDGLDFGGGIVTEKGSSKFLDVYTVDDVKGWLDGSGILEGLRKAGYSHPVLKVDLSDTFVHRCTVSDAKLLKRHGRSASVSPTRSLSPTKSNHHMKSPSESPTPVADIETHSFPIEPSNFLIDMFLRRKDITADDIQTFQISTGDKVTIRSKSSSIPQLTRTSTILLDQMEEFRNQHNPSRPTTANPNHHHHPPSSTTIPQSTSPPTSPTQPNQPVHPLTKLLTNLQTRSQSYINTHFPKPYIKSTDIAWTCLQNPLQTTFPNHKPPLPGQRHPGLGLARQFMKGILQAASESRRDVLINTPDHFHNAVLCNWAGWRFVDPVVQGVFVAAFEDLVLCVDEGDRNRRLGEVSWAFFEGRVVRRVSTGRGSFEVVERWEHYEQFFPVSGVMQRYFSDERYVDIVRDTCEVLKGQLRIVD